MRTYCKDCQPALGTLERVHLCSYHAATHEALAFVKEASLWPLPMSAVGGSDMTFHARIALDLRERARDIMASIAGDVLSRIGGHSEATREDEARWLVQAMSCEACSRPDSTGPCYRCAVNAVMAALGQAAR